MRVISIVETAILLLCVLLTIAFAETLRATGMSFDAKSSSLFILLIVIPLFVYAFYRTIRPDEGVATITFALATQTWGACMVGGISLAACRWQMPFIDANLAAIDAAMGVNVFPWVETIAHMPEMVRLFARAYGWSVHAIVVVPWILTFAGRADRARELVFLFVSTLATCCLIGSFLPATGSHVFMHIPSATNGLLPNHPLAFMKSVEAYRSGSATTIRFDDLDGIITFPSFHACLGLMFIWSVRGMSRFIFWPMAAFGGMTLGSIIPCGGHYVIDGIGALVVFGAAVAMFRRLETGALASGISADRSETAPPWRSPPSEPAFPG